MYPALTDQSVLNDVFLKVRQSLIWSVMRIVKDRQAAEDLAQDTYLRARKAIDRGSIDHIEAFLHQTARNLAIDHQRRKSLVATIVTAEVPEIDTANIAADGTSPEDCLIHRERLVLLYEALGQLPQRAQTAWILSRVEKWSHARIAEHLGVSPNTIYNDLKTAIGHCHDALARLDRL
jgi:RNA polymerase sigma factor (sigma-70 family)